MPRNRLSILLVAVVAVVLLAYSVFRPRLTDAERRPLPPQVHKLRAVGHALLGYRQAMGVFPYDSRGFRYALYKLHSDVPASAFQLNESSQNTPPRFDHDAQQLVGGDIVYFNYPLKDLGPERVIVLGIGGAQQAWVLTSHGTPSVRSFPTPADSSVLGSFMTLDDFLVTTREAYGKWRMTHFAPFAIHSESDQVQSTQGPVHTNYFRYIDSRLSSCRVETRHGTVTEDVVTDRLGQIVSLSRSPSDSERLIELLWADLERESR